jgi:hypothetical protein
MLVIRIPVRLDPDFFKQFRILERTMSVPAMNFQSRSLSCGKTAGSENSDFTVDLRMLYSAEKISHNLVTQYLFRISLFFTNKVIRRH